MSNLINQEDHDIFSFSDTLHLASVILEFIEDSPLCTQRGWGHWSLKQIAQKNAQKKSLQTKILLYILIKTENHQNQVFITPVKPIQC